MDYFKQERLNAEDLIIPTAPQVMVCICVDSSYSMIQEGRIDKVNQGIRNFINKTLADDYARDSIDLCIVTFGKNNPVVTQSFVNVSKIKFQDIIPEGGTPLGKALKLAINEIKERRSFFATVGTQCYKSWLIVMSDDESDDDLTEAAKEINQMIDDNELKVKCINVGNNINNTKGLSVLTKDGKVDSLESFEILDFFDMLSKKAAGMSMASPEDDIGLNI